jgi:hypothetical protein
MDPLERAVNDAYERAQTSTNPDDWKVYHALNAALHAERHPPAPPGDTTGIPSPQEAGFASEINIVRGED